MVVRHLEAILDREQPQFAHSGDGSNTRDLGEPFDVQAAQSGHGFDAIKGGDGRGPDVEALQIFQRDDDVKELLRYPLADGQSAEALHAGKKRAPCGRYFMALTERRSTREVHGHSDDE